MPTGYTAILQEQPDLPFTEFALRCARNFGACIMQRDDDLSSLIVMDKPVDYYATRVQRTKDRLAWLERAPEADLMREQEKQIAEHEQRRQKYIDESRSHRRSYERMLAMAREWSPPTPDHDGLRRFNGPANRGVDPVRLPRRSAGTSAAVDAR